MSVNPKENPFTLTYTAIVQLLCSNPHFKRLVETGNIIRFDSANNFDPFKQDIKAGDLPEIIVISDGFVSNMHHTSSTSRVIKRYSLLIATGNKQINYLLNQVQWEVLVAMVNWKNVLGALQWRDESFVKRVDVLDVVEGLSNSEQNRGIEGWSSVWRCEVEMYFETSEILSLI